MSYTKYALIAIIFLSWYPLFSQNDFEIEYPVPLSQKSYEEIENHIKNTDNDSLKHIYISIYLNKVKQSEKFLK